MTDPRDALLLAVEALEALMTPPSGLAMLLMRPVLLWPR